MGSRGFNIPHSSAHAIFLDLPEPWLAVPRTSLTLKPNSCIVSYSSCVEQSQKTFQKMTECGFHSLKTVEVRLREYYVDNVGIGEVPT